MILRRIARPMLAAVFVSGGVETLRNPKPRIQAAEPHIDKAVGQVGAKASQVKEKVQEKVPEGLMDKVPEGVKEKLPANVPTDAETLVKVNAVAQIGAGVLLALGKLPRLSALVLAGSVVPTTLTGHRFWETEDPAERARQQSHFFKNMGLLGGLLLAAADTHGKPSVAWRAKNATRGATSAVQGAAQGATSAVQGAALGAVSSVEGAARGAQKSAKGAARGAKKSAKGAAKSAKVAAKTAKGAAKSVLPS